MKAKNKDVLPQNLTGEGKKQRVFRRVARVGNGFQFTEREEEALFESQRIGAGIESTSEGPTQT